MTTDIRGDWPYDCHRCNYDIHRCPGCGEPLPHDTEICAECAQIDMESIDPRDELPEDVGVCFHHDRVGIPAGKSCIDCERERYS